jgi:hypothetical protein
MSGAASRKTRRYADAVGHISNSTCTIPPAKNEAAHKVQLSEPALALLEQIKGFDPRIGFPRVQVISSSRPLSAWITELQWHSACELVDSRMQQQPAQIAKAALARHRPVSRAAARGPG